MFYNKTYTLTVPIFKTKRGTYSKPGTFSGPWFKDCWSIGVTANRETLLFKTILL